MKVLATGGGMTERRHRERSFSRRHLLRAGVLGCLGLALPHFLQARAAARPTGPAPGLPPIRSCIMLFLYGGPSHLDTWDMKPGAPAEIRGEFRPVATSVPGLRVCEHLPRMARLMHKVALVRGMHHPMRNHDSACTETFTGRPLFRGDTENFSPVSESLAPPSYGAMLSYVRRGRPAELPHAVLPFFIRNLFPPPGQAGGFLGTAYSPFLIKGDPGTRNYHAEMLRLAAGLTPERLDRRATLLDTLGRGAGPATAEREQYDKAFHLLRSAAVHRALDVEQEPRRVRERYGLGWQGNYAEDNSGGVLDFAQQLRGQNLLLARRLVEAGVPFVNVSDYMVQGANWDTHTLNFAKLKGHLLPPADQALSALVEDLDERGLLDCTLVVVLGEFGRTPRINKNAGRDHWPDCYSVVLAGGGVRGGAVYGSSDKAGAYPDADPVTPGDLAATIFWRFGIDPSTEIQDSTGRPYRLAEGEPIRRLFEHG
jgi:hypothetical protein